MLQLESYLKSFGILTEEEIQSALKLFFKEEFKQGSYYLNNGEYVNKISFIEHGLFRLFYHIEGTEKIMLFFYESQFMTDYFGFLTRSKSIRPIQALENSLVYSIQRENLNYLFERFKNWERLGRLLAESAYITSVLKANRLLHDDHNTRVETFIKETPDLIQRVPQYMIASYLQMTPETLSRVKKRIMKEVQIKNTIHKNF